jgi:hypothetical protein
MARFKSADDNRQSYTSRSPTSKSKSKTTTSSGGGGGGQNSNYNQYTAYTPAQVKSGKAKVTADITKDNATAFDNLKFTKKFTPSILGMTLNVTGLAEKGFYANKAYYEKNVIGKNNFTKSIDSYKDYMSKRGSGEIDAMGRTITNGSGNGNTQPGITKNIGGSTIQTTAPTTAEVSQSEATNSDAAALKVKKRGRSQSIMTSSQGVTKTSPNYSLGKKSLLGRV